MLLCTIPEPSECNTEKEVDGKVQKERSGGEQHQSK